MPFSFELGNVHARLVGQGGDFTEVREFLHDYLSYEPVGARYARRYTNWDGVKRIFSLRTHKFPAGYLPSVIRVLHEEGFVAGATVDQRIKPAAPTCSIQDLGAWWDAPKDSTSPDYRFQIDAVKAIRKHGRGIIRIPTGGGKTNVMVRTAQWLPARWLVFTPGKDLLHNAADRWEALTGEEAGRIGDGWFIVGSSFTVATLQSCAKGLADRDPDYEQLLRDWATGLMGDESHTAPAKTFGNVLTNCQSAFYRLGFSATPLDRADEKSNMAIGQFGPIIYEISRERLVALNVVAQAHAELWHFTTTGDAGTWQSAEKRFIVEGTARNSRIVQMVAKAAKPALVFVKRQKHGEVLAELLRRAGMEATFIWSKASTSQRESVRTRLLHGDLQVVVASDIWKQGVDIPNLASVVMAAGGQSVIDALQKTGRGSRTDGGNKTEFTVYDILDRGQKWLHRHANARRLAYKREGYTLTEVK